jgi:hypothetical protein
MRRFGLLGLLGLSVILGTSAERDAARVPVLLELFTSEGCSSCPPADQLLQVLDQEQPLPGADLIVLSEHVDYWDKQGWKDPFSSPLYTARQQDYAAKLHVEDVFTPQLVVDGTFGLVGSNTREAASAINKAVREQKIPVSISNLARGDKQVTAHIELGALPQKTKGIKPVLYVVLAENRVESKVARGENVGRLLAHVAVTRVLQQAGPVDLESPSSKDVTLPVQAGAGSNGLRVIAFIQDRRSGHILGVAGQKL